MNEKPILTWAPLLLADRSPNLRLLALRELPIESATDQEVKEGGYTDREIEELAAIREEDPIVQEILARQDPDGSWRASAGGVESWARIRTTAHALTRLGYLGFGPEHPSVKWGAEYLFSHQIEDGSWPLPEIKAEREMGEAYEMIPLQTGLPLRALAAAGFASDPRAEAAYEWLLAQRLPDGAWPSGRKAGQNVFPAGYRRLAHSRFGCRSNTTFALLALAHHPERRRSEAARRGLDLLLAQETLQAHTLGIEVARMIGVELASGYFTYFARYDAALMLDLCWRIGASLDDPRIAALASFVKDLQGSYGLWEHPTHPQASRWLTLDLLRSLARLDQHGDWISLEPRTPFQPYPKQPKRY
jgi:hypothetical protein